MRINDIPDPKNASALLKLNWDTARPEDIISIFRAFPLIKPGPLLALYDNEDLCRLHQTRIEAILSTVGEEMIPITTASAQIGVAMIAAQMHPELTVKILEHRGDKISASEKLAAALTRSSADQVKIDRAVMDLAEACPSAADKIAAHHQELSLSLARLYPESAAGIARLCFDYALEIGKLSPQHAISISEALPQFKEALQQHFTIET